MKCISNSSHILFNLKSLADYDGKGMLYHVWEGNRSQLDVSELAYACEGRT